jgi:hypothetical protein
LPDAASRSTAASRDDRPLAEQVLAEPSVERRVVPAEPPEQHHGVLDLLVSVVLEDLPPPGVAGRVDPLLDQSMASSSSIRLTIARCLSRVSGRSRYSAS